MGEQDWDDVAWPADVQRPDDLADIVRWDAAELSVAVRERLVSCVEVMTAHLDHIEAVNPLVNAVVALRPRDELLAEAAEKDRLLDRGERQGWMHGFPHAVKDLADVAGLPTSYGLLPRARPARTDATFVARLRAAGAVFVGKTTTPQLGLGSHTVSDVHGTTLNAWDQSRSAGGSSGGAAVAVALRMLPVADGSDFMGSLRNPPGWNGVLGLRPSFGRVPSAGGDQFVDQGGVLGPVARTALDLALLLRTMAGYDDRAPLSVRQDPATLTRLDPQRVRGRRVAWLGDLGGYLPVEDDVRTVTTRALSTFERLGMEVTHLDALPTAPGFAGEADLWPTWLTYRHWLAGTSVKAFHDLEAVRPLLRPPALYEVAGLVGGDGRPALDALAVHRASQKRSAMYEAFRRLFETYDHVVLPTAQTMPFAATTTWPTEVAGRPMTSYHRWMEVSVVATMIGAPTLAVPAGLSDDGLPIGLQVLGRNHDELALLDLAQAWQDETGSHRSLPPLLQR